MSDVSKDEKVLTLEWQLLPLLIHISKAVLTASSFFIYAGAFVLNLCQCKSSYCLKRFK